MKFIKFILLLFLSFGNLKFERIVAQCIPAPSETCEEANVFCSLDQMNGYTCNTPGNIKSTCRTACTNGIPGNRDWLAFVTQGGNVTITMQVGTCTPINPFSNGICWGIWGDCNCGEEIICVPWFVPPGQSETYQINLKPCKTYYMTFDHDDEICDFTLSTSGGGPPNLFLGHINNKVNDIIEPVCEGYCGYKFFVDQGGCLEANYEWTLDGNKVGDSKHEISLDFPTQGDFRLCVTATLGNPNNGFICAQQGPTCTTVKVRSLADKNGTPRTLCYEIANPAGYKWHSQLINTSGIYRQNFIDNTCCPYDSVVQFTVLPQVDPPDVYYISCDNKPYIDALGRRWNPCLAQEVIAFPKSNGLFKCDSSIKLTAINVDFNAAWSAQCVGNKVVLSPNISILKACDVGETYAYEYKWYKKNDSLKTTIEVDERILVNAVNEDYCVDVKLKVVLGTSNLVCTKTFCDTIREANAQAMNHNILVQACDSVLINGQTYTQSTTFTQNLTNVFGCDSIIITTLSIAKNSSSNLKMNACDSIQINGLTYSQSGNYVQKLINAQQCDSLINIDLEISKSSITNLVSRACDSILVNGQYYYQSGIYSQELTSSKGCDSILNLDIQIQSSQLTNVSYTDCDSVVINGKTYKQSGDYFELLKGQNDCDSTVKIHINIPSSNTAPYILTACDSAFINGTKYFQSGTYTQLLTSTNGCDSTLNINLTIGKSNVANLSLTSCDSILINGQRYDQSGNYTQLLQTINHCDSILNIDLLIPKSSSSNYNISACDSISINGKVYTQTGSYTQTFSNANLCDSIVTIHFTKQSGDSINLNYKSCDFVDVNGQIYNQSGNYIQTLKNKNHCDSILNIKVIITKSDSTNFTMTSCDSAIVNGQVYKQTGSYEQRLKNSLLCDSILNLILTIQNSSFINYSTTACDSAIINGQIYRQSGIYKQYIKDVYQCDSIINITVNLLKSNSQSLTHNACDSIVVNGITYDTSGNYIQTLRNRNGCDSTLFLKLTIKPGNPGSLEAGMDTLICEGEQIKLTGLFSGQANFIWESQNGSFDNPNTLNTNYYPSIAGQDRIYLKATDDCKQWIDSLWIRVLPKQIIQITGDTIINPCKVISFTANGATNYQWTPSTLVECLDLPCSKVKLKATVPTRFTITSNGPCVVPANLNLSVSQIQTDIFVPNVFSPNGDNINDLFIPIMNCDQLNYYNLQIFDRWGNLLFESQNKENGWNGKFEEISMPPGVYPFVIQYQLHNEEKKIKAGELTLIK
ncbi:MAG: gliding motility-associated C-terminal domain-containing protein [Saprospiraceae bacterium]|nr:gliding motility-associated C-terminal domain-containing protein [Saprospiraceae bacterium]